MQRVMHPAKKLVIDLMADEVSVSEDEAAPVFTRVYTRYEGD